MSWEGPSSAFAALLASIRWQFRRFSIHPGGILGLQPLRADNAGCVVRLTRRRLGDHSRTFLPPAGVAGRRLRPMTANWWRPGALGIDRRSFAASTPTRMLCGWLRATVIDVRVNNQTARIPQGERRKMQTG